MLAVPVRLKRSLCGAATSCQSVQVTACFGSRNHEAPFASKYNHVCIDGEPYNGSGPALTASGVNGRDEIAECQALLLIGFHDTHLSFA